MGKYFGTDGFRGEAGIDLTADHAYKVGRFLGWYYNALRERNGNNEPARIVIGKDTRRSSYMFEYSLVAGLTASGADAYLAQTDVKPAPYTDPVGNYSAMAQSDIGIPWVDGAENFERNLERIIVQKWIAIFPLGVEAWSEHRRTGYPKLLPVPTDKSGGTVDVAQGARRLPYPVEEYQQNNANLQLAIQTLDGEQQNGNRTGDVMGTRVWWDCKSYNN